VVNPANTSKSHTNANLKSAFANALAELELDVDYAAWQVTNQHYVSDLANALKLIDSRLLDYKSKNKKATIVVL